MNYSAKICLVILAITAMTVAGARADYSDDFESYNLGNIGGQGPWVDWGGASLPEVSSAQAHSGGKSLALSAGPEGGYGSDCYIANINGSLVTTGQWNLSYWLYTPASFDGFSHMYFSQVPMQDFSAGADMRSNSEAGTDPAQFEYQHADGPSTTDLVFDQWAKVELLIDLDANAVNASYNGSPLYSGVWDQNAEDESGPSIGGLNCWSAGAASAGTVSYIDDLSLTAVPVPEPTTLTLALMGLSMLGAVCWRRRK